MRTDFTPVYLQQANEKLDDLMSSLENKYEPYEEIYEKESLWKRFLRLFKRNPFELPEELYKGR